MNVESGVGCVTLIVQKWERWPLFLQTAKAFRREFKVDFHIIPIYDADYPYYVLKFFPIVEMGYDEMKKALRVFFASVRHLKNLKIIKSLLKSNEIKRKSIEDKLNEKQI